MKLSQRLIDDLKIAAATATQNQSSIWIKAIANVLELIASDIRKEVEREEKEGKP